MCAELFCVCIGCGDVGLFPPAQMMCIVLVLQRLVTSVVLLAGKNVDCFRQDRIRGPNTEEQ